MSYYSLMNVIQELKEKLSEYQGIKFEESKNRIEVFPATGDVFNVSLDIDEDGYIVWYEGWHGHFQDADEAQKSFMFGLSGACRLKVS